MNPSELSNWMATYTLHPERKEELPSLVGEILKAVANSNASARMAAYAFLDTALGEGWEVGLEVSRTRLRELRKYDLKGSSFQEPWHIDARYGAFFASADYEYLRGIVSLIRYELTHPLRRAAEWSLTSIMEQYPHVATAVRNEGVVS